MRYDRTGIIILFAAILGSYVWDAGVGFYVAVAGIVVAIVEARSGK